MPIIESLKKSFTDLVNKGELNYPQLLTLEKMQKMSSVHVQAEIAKMRNLAIRIYEAQQSSVKQDKKKNAMMFVGVKKSNAKRAKKSRKKTAQAESQISAEFKSKNKLKPTNKP